MQPHVCSLRPHVNFMWSQWLHFLLGTVNHLSGPLRKEQFTSSRVKRSPLSVQCDWQILIHFVCFYFFNVKIMIDSSGKHNWRAWCKTMLSDYFETCKDFLSKVPFICQNKEFSLIDYPCKHSVSIIVWIKVVICTVTIFAFPLISWKTQWIRWPANKCPSNVSLLNSRPKCWNADTLEEKKIPRQNHHSA